MIGVLRRLIRKSEDSERGDSAPNFDHAVNPPSVSRKQMRLPGMKHPSVSLFHGHDQPAPKPGGAPLPDGPHGWNPDKGQFMATRGCPVGTVHKWSQGWFRKNAAGEWEPMPHQQGTGGMLDIAEDLKGEHLPAGASINVVTAASPHFAMLDVPSATGRPRRLRHSSTDAFHMLRNHGGADSHMDMLVNNTRAFADDISRAARDLATLRGPGFDEQPEPEVIGRAIEMIKDGLDLADVKVEVPWRDSSWVDQIGDGLYLLTDDEAQTPIGLHFRTIVNRGDFPPQTIISVQVGGNETSVWVGTSHEFMENVKSGVLPVFDLREMSTSVAAHIEAAYRPKFAEGAKKLEFSKTKRGQAPEQLTGSWQTSRLSNNELHRIAEEYEKDKKVHPFDPLEHDAVFADLPYSYSKMQKFGKEYGYQGTADRSGVLVHEADGAVSALKRWCRTHGFTVPPITPKHIVKMAGIPDHFKVDKLAVKRGASAEAFVISIYGSGVDDPDDHEGSIERSLIFHRDGRVEVHNDYFRAPKAADPDAKRGGRGYGARMLLTQATALTKFHKAAGLFAYPKMTTQAAGSFGDALFDGYWVWAHLGYQSDEKGPHGESWEEMMSTPEGAAWWRANGSYFSGEFSLRPGSYSISRLYHYVKDRYEGKAPAKPKRMKRAPKVATVAPEPPAPEEPPSVRQRLFERGDKSSEVEDRANAFHNNRAEYDYAERQTDGVNVESIPAPESGGYTDSKGRLHTDAHRRVSFPPLPSGQPVVVRVFSDGSHMSHRATAEQIKEALRVAGKSDGVGKGGKGRAPRGDDYDALDRAGRSWCHLVARRLKAVRKHIGGGGA